MDIIDNYIIYLSDEYDIRILFINLLQLYSKESDVKIHIINYRDLNVRSLVDECYSKWKENNFDFGKSDIVIVDTHVVSRSWIESYLEGLSEDDYVFILGMERLLPYSNTVKVVETKTDEVTYNSTYLHNEDWQGLTEWIDYIYGKYQNKLKGIIGSVLSDDPTGKLINQHLDDSMNLSIVGIMDISGSTKRLEIDSKWFYNKLEVGEHDFLIDYLVNKKSQLDTVLFIDLLKDVYLNFGFVEETIQLLLNESDLRLDHKKLLIDLMISKIDKREICKRLANEIYEKNKYAKDLMPTLLRVYDGDEEFEKWLKISLHIDPENPKVLEIYANCLSDENKYLEAATQFSSLRAMTKNDYFELPERINLLLENPSKNYIENIDFILDPFSNNPNTFNDALYRLCIYYQTKQKSEYITYTLLNKIDFSGDIETQIPLLELKSDILMDIVSAKRALGKLKPERRDEHKVIIGRERMRFIVKSINAFAKVERGYLEWGKFVDHSQSREAWGNFIIDELIYWLKEVRKLDVKSLYNQSCANLIKLDMNSGNGNMKAIRLLKAITFEQFEDNNIDNLIIGVLKYAELEKSDLLKIWSRFYSAIIKTYYGLFQESNDLALTILEYYDKVAEIHKDVSIQLGLTSWAVSQYKIGRKTEGMLCLFSSMFNMDKSQEILPFIEFGLPMICDYIQKNFRDLTSVQKQQLAESISFFRSYNSDVEYTIALLSNELDLHTKVSYLMLKPLEKKSKDWRDTIIETIDGMLVDNNCIEAIKIINLNAEQLVESLSCRIDIRPNKIISWLELIQSDNQYDCLEKDTFHYLVNIAFNDLENSRKVKHKAERAAIGEKTNVLARLTLEFFANLESEKKGPIKLLEDNIDIFSRIVSYLTPRAFAEQKKYYKDSVVSDELKELEQKCLLLKTNYQILYDKTNGKSESLNSLGLRIQEILEQLKVEHPNYRPLREQNTVNLMAIKESLRKHEICFQFIVLNNYVVQIMISCENVFVEYSSIDVADFSAKLDTLNHVLNDDGRVSTEMLHDISEKTVSMLFSEDTTNELTELYMLPDISIGSFNSNLCFYDGEWLIDKFISVKCLMDYDIVRKSKEVSRVNKIGNRIFGCEEDSNLNLIREYLEESKDNNFLVFDNNDDSINLFVDELSMTEVNSLFIFGHGVTDPMMKNHGGAQGIQGMNRLIRLEELLKKLNLVENVLFLSCSGGVPLEDRREDLTGYWADTFSTFEGSLILCRWNVLTKSSIELVNEYKKILVHNGDAAKSLNMALKVMKSNEEIIGKWSGLECWYN